MIARTLTQKARIILGDLPPWYEVDDISTAIIQVLAKEIKRIEDFVGEVRLQMYPGRADDKYGILARWEEFFGLPVQPNVPLATRQQLVAAQLAKRRASTGHDWELAVTTALGSGDWDYYEGPGNYQVTITYPYRVGAYTSVQVANLIREITPAHIQILASYRQGFLVGISLVGDIL